MNHDEQPPDDQKLIEPKEHKISYVAGRRSIINPQTIVASAIEYDPGVLYVRLDDQINLEFWLVLMIEINSQPDGQTESKRSRKSHDYRS